VCSFENPPEEHISKVVEKRLRMPFWDGPRMRMSEAELHSALAWVNDHFFFIRADDEAPTIDWILERAAAAVARYGVRGLIIDPYNEIEAKRPPTMSETEYVSQLLGKVKRFAQTRGVHVWFVAHPAKMLRSARSGSSGWGNRDRPRSIMTEPPGSTAIRNPNHTGAIDDGAVSPDQILRPIREHVQGRQPVFRGRGRRGEGLGAAEQERSGRRAGLESLLHGKARSPTQAHRPASSLGRAPSVRRSSRQLTLLGLALTRI
jgi:hypothetical protein